MQLLERKEHPPLENRGTTAEGAGRHRNYAARGREGAIYGRAILLGLGALEWEERAQHRLLWRFVTLYSIIL